VGLFSRVLYNMEMACVGCDFLAVSRVGSKLAYQRCGFLSFSLLLSMVRSVVVIGGDGSCR
jgi:hypothetical protein